MLEPHKIELSTWKEDVKNYTDLSTITITETTTEQAGATQVASGGGDDSAAGTNWRTIMEVV